MRCFHLFTIAALVLVALVPLAACGDDDDDGGGERLTNEEYFAELTRLDKELDDRAEGELGNEEAGAQAYAEFYHRAAQDYQDSLNDLNPPEELQDEHDALIAALKAFGDAAADVEFEEDAPAEDFFENEDVGILFAAVDPPFCALQAIADDLGIDADVGCEEEGDTGEPAPGELEPVETGDVLIENLEFEPPHIQVAAGDTVTWTQGGDGLSHTATSDDDVFDSGTLGDEGETFEFTFEEAGEYAYHCQFHQDMLGLVTVTE